MQEAIDALYARHVCGMLLVQPQTQNHISGTMSNFCH